MLCHLKVSKLRTNKWDSTRRKFPNWITIVGGERGGDRGGGKEKETKEKKKPSSYESTSTKSEMLKTTSCNKKITVHGYVGALSLTFSI